MAGNSELTHIFMNMYIYIIVYAYTLYYNSTNKTFIFQQIKL